MSGKRAGYRLFALSLSACALAIGADWLTKRGDPQRTGWQKDERFLTVRTVKGLRLLWKQKLNGRLTDPLLLGPIITHRGIKELVFVKDSTDTIYAVDADLGRIFWSRNLARGVSKAACAEDRRIMPVMASADESASSVTEDDDNFSDGSKPLYALSAAGSLHALRTSTGEDFSPSLPFLPPSARPVSLEISHNVLYATTSPVCGGLPNRVWTINLSVSGLPIGPDPQGRSWKSNSQALTAFPWKGRDLLTGLAGSNKPVFLNAGSDGLLLDNTASTSNRFGGLATWQDTAGTRWIYATSHSGVMAFQVAGPSDRPTAVPSWTSHRLTAAGPPIVANGIVYLLSVAVCAKSSCLTLHALDALNGNELYASGEITVLRLPSGNIAIANGHLCFSADGVLYCFGLPFEM